MSLFVVDQEKCNSCGICVKVCPQVILEIPAKKEPVQVKDKDMCVFQFVQAVSSEASFRAMVIRINVQFHVQLVPKVTPKAQDLLQLLIAYY